jgi:hypothetical protein
MLRSSRRARALLLLPVLATLLATPGCFGPFKAVKAIHEFNDSFRKDWAKELVFLGFVILPVYEFGILIDVIVLNTVEFFGG